MTVTRSLLLVALAGCLAGAVRADGQFDRDEEQRYRKAMDKLIWGDTPRPGVPVGRDRFAAIAYSPSTGAVGSATGCPARLEAGMTARAKCRAADARTVVWVRNGYCALALGKTPGVYAVGCGATAEQAKAAALRDGRTRSADCTIVACVFSGREADSVGSSGGTSPSRRPARR